MSELDYEDEVNENKTKSTCDVEQTPFINSIQDQSNKVECTEMSQKVQRNSEDGEIESDTGEVLDSDRDLPDLEEGEINDENTDGSNFVVCRFFQQGNCRFGKQCRFVHVGASAYKMFDSCVSTKNFRFTVPPQHIYYSQKKQISPVYSERNGGDAWEQGLEEAKKLLLIAKDKKETDVEFEDKKLYLQIEKEAIEIDREAIVKKRHTSDKKKKEHKKSKTSFKPSPSEYTEKETKSKKSKKHSKSTKVSPEIWTDPWRRSRSRTRNRSRSSSSTSASLSSRHWTPKSSSSSLCSMCSSENYERQFKSKKRGSKVESKLQRAFSRTFSRSRSRKRSLSCSRSRSKSRAASLKRSLYRSYSRSRSPSSSASWCSKKSSIHKALVRSSSKFEQPSSSVSKTLHSPKQHKRKLGPESPTSNRWLKETVSSECESYSSDLTVSSITCTTFSGTRSSVDSGSVKRAKVTVSPNIYNKKSVYSDELYCQKYENNLERENSYNKYKNEKSTTILPESKSSDKLMPDVLTETSTRKVYLKTDLPVSNKKDDHNQKLRVKKTEKKSALEMELLKYLPSKSRHAAIAQKEKLSTKSTEAINEPKKAISISLKPKSKFVPTKSVLSSPVLKSPPKVVEKPLSRREHLLRQLEAVEMAIAKRKRLS